MLEQALVVIANRDRRNEPRDWMNGLEWDGKPRLNTWLHDFAGVIDNAYTQACARKTLCAAVMRVMKPGIAWATWPFRAGDC